MTDLNLTVNHDTIEVTVSITRPDDAAWVEATGDGLAVVELAADEPVNLRLIGPPAVLRATLLDAVWQLGALQ